MRPILRYFGGKWILSNWIISHFPNHKIYVEPFGGAASVLLRKPRSYAEIYNDLNSEIVNLFKITRDQGQELKKLLYNTPFSREEFNLSYEPTDDPIEQARRTIVRSFQGFGADSGSSNNKTGFRSNSNRSGTTPAHDWKNYAEAFDEIIERLRGVVIENRDAMDVCKAHDSKDTLHYIDPPYVHATRSAHGYKHEMNDQQHIDLADSLNKLDGMIILSGYPSKLYEELYSDWKMVTRSARADKAGKRVECLWMKNIDSMTLF